MPYLTKEIFGSFTISPDNHIGTYGPRKISFAGLSDNELRTKIKAPFGSKPLSELARGKRSILIITDDNTRQTPVQRLLPIVLDELKLAGIAKERIMVLIGLGTHRPMTAEEIKHKFGASAELGIPIINHAWNDPKSIYSLGCCDLGFEVVMNRLVQETDLIVTIGSIVPHATTGFSGGGKTIMPGICGEATIENTHWTALDYEMSAIIGNFQNRIREAIVHICRSVGEIFIINTVLFSGDAIFELVAGDLEEAHRVGTQAAKDLLAVSVPCPADIVIAEAYPTDIDLRQAIKAMCTADIVCRKNGVIILPAECPEGIAPQFPTFESYGFNNPHGLYRDVEQGVCTEKLLAYTLVAVGRIMASRRATILVSPNISNERAKRLGFDWSPDMKAALEKARNIMGKNASTLILRQAGELLPLCIGGS